MTITIFKCHTNYIFEQKIYHIYVEKSWLHVKFVISHLNIMVYTTIYNF